MIDSSTAFGKRAEKRLRSEIVAWFTSVDRAGTPQPIPVWFVWDGESFLLYSQPDTAKLRNLERNSRVSLNLDGNGRGGDIIVVTGEATVEPEHPRADQVSQYVAKYEDEIRRIGYGTAEAFAAAYSVPIRIRPLKLRGF